MKTIDNLKYMDPDKAKSLIKAINLQDNFIVEFLESTIKDSEIREAILAEFAHSNRLYEKYGLAHGISKVCDMIGKEFKL